MINVTKKKVCEEGDEVSQDSGLSQDLQVGCVLRYTGNMK